jgi:hypothetical protein
MMNLLMNPGLQQVVLAKKDDIDPVELEDDPALVHSTLATLPKIDLALPASPPDHSTPSLALSSSTPLASDDDPDVAVPASRPDDHDDNRPPPSPSSSSGTSSPASGIYVETLVKNTLDLYAAYPLDHAKIRAHEIMGPRSAIFTWGDQWLSDSQAVEIAHETVDVVNPEPPQEEEYDEGVRDEKKGKDEEDEKSGERKRRLGGRKGALLSHLGAELSVGVLVTVLGVAGLLVALYGTDTRRALGGWRGIWVW